MSKGLNPQELSLVKAKLSQMLLQIESTSERMHRAAVRARMIALMEKAANWWSIHESSAMAAELLGDLPAAQRHHDEASKWEDVAQEIKAVLEITRDDE